MDGQELVKQTLEQIPQADPNATRIVDLVKQGGRITGYMLSEIKRAALAAAAYSATLPI